MKVTKQRLKKIIREEINRTLKEAAPSRCAEFRNEYAVIMNKWNEAQKDLHDKWYSAVAYPFIQGKVKKQLADLEKKYPNCHRGSSTLQYAPDEPNPEGLAGIE